MSEELDTVLAGGEPKKPWPAALQTWLRAALMENLALKFVAFVLALTVFILVHSDEDATLGASVGVSYSQLDDRVLVSERVDEVRITVRGSRRRVKRFSESDLENIYVNLQNLSDGRYRFSPDMFDIPEGLELVEIEPESIYLEFDERVQKTVPVRVDTTGAPAQGYKVQALTTSPASVTISGAERFLERVESVSTREVDLSGRKASYRAQVPLVGDSFQFVGPETVTVEVSLVEELESRQFLAIPVAIRPGPGLTEEAAKGFRVEPGTVKVTLYGSHSAIAALDPAALEVFVELEPADVSGSGDNRADVRIAPKLPGIAYKLTPADVTLVPR